MTRAAHWQGRGLSRAIAWHPPFSASYCRSPSCEEKTLPPHLVFGWQSTSLKLVMLLQICWFVCCSNFGAGYSRTSLCWTHRLRLDCSLLQVTTSFTSCNSVLLCKGRALQLLPEELDLFFLSEGPRFLLHVWSVCTAFFTSFLCIACSALHAKSSNMH